MILTPRQLEVLYLVAYSNREIAQRLEIGYQTVKNHFTDIYIKLLGEARTQVRSQNRIRALTVALREDMIQLENVDYGRPIMERGEQA